MRQLKAIIKTAKNGEVYAVLLARNGEPLATTETQKRKATLIRTLRRNFPGFVVQT